MKKSFLVDENGFYGDFGIAANSKQKLRCGLNQRWRESILDSSLRFCVLRKKCADWIETNWYVYNWW